MKSRKNNKKIPLFEIYSDRDDVDAVVRVLKSKMNWAKGVEIEKFENDISQFIGVKHALTFNSGTSAIYSSLLAAGIGRGDEVIAPAFTYIATVEPISLCGAKPVFADIEERTMGLDPADVERKISKKTKAIIAVHYAGIPCQISALAKIAKKRKIILIEDAAEAFGSTVGGRKVGGFGDLAIFSFSQGKIITTGEGGAVVTRSKRLYDELKLIRSLGRREASDTTHVDLPFDFIQPGHNLCLSNILAALGISQLSKIDKVMKKRMQLANYYKSELLTIDGVSTLNCPSANSCGYPFFPILADNRDGLHEYLSNHKIASKIYFQPVYNHYLYQNNSQVLPVTEQVSKRVLSIPFYASMKKEDADYVVSIIKQFHSL